MSALLFGATGKAGCMSTLACRYNVMIIPWKLLICFVWLTEILTGMMSPRRNPAFSNSIVAVIVFSFNDVLLPFSVPPLSPVLTDNRPESIPEPVTLLNWLSKLTSLGAGLPGVWLSVTLLNSGTRLFRGTSAPSTLCCGESAGVVRFLVLLLALDLRSIGSSDMTLGFGSRIGAISIVSTKSTFVSCVVVGEIVVGRVNVADNMYEIVPRSNYSSPNDQRRAL